MVITEYFEPFVIGIYFSVILYIFTFFFNAILQFFYLGTLLTPIKYLGAVTSICLNHRGVPIKSTPMDDDHIALQFHLPLSEVHYY